jgi:hypothetical protein
LYFSVKVVAFAAGEAAGEAGEVLEQERLLKNNQRKGATQMNKNTQTGKQRVR